VIARIMTENQYRLTDEDAAALDRMDDPLHEAIKSGDAFNIRNVPARLKRMRGDPWAGYDSLRQSLDGITDLPGK